MGAAIAARLHQTGEDVIVWNCSHAKTEATGLPVAVTPHDLADRADVIISTLLDAPDLRAVYHSPDGLLGAALGKLFIEIRTVRPET
jgi:3-hydroxyisobutyrate dehydrogenase